MKNKDSSYWMVRLLLVSRIIIVLFALAFALLLWRQNSNKLTESVEKLTKKNINIEMLERGITNLYNAENNFRFYSATYDRSFFDAYSGNLITVSKIIDTLQFTLENEEYTKNIGNSIAQKADISNLVIRLKRLTDSLLTVAGQWDTSSFAKVEVPKFDIKKIQNLSRKASIDSLIPDTSKLEKKGFFKKVKELFKDGTEVQNKKIVVKHSEETTDTTINTSITASPEYALLQDIHKYYATKISSYSDGRNRLNAQERALAEINTKLISEISSILKSVKDSEFKRTEAVKKEAEESTKTSSRIISTLAIISVLLATIFLFLVIFYLRKIKEANLKMNSERKKAIDLARQKTRFLSAMSHELRAPLNNITGFSEQFQNATEAEKPVFMEAITTSANIMLSTVNQILDYSKLESGKAIVNNLNFSPYQIIEKASSTLLLKARNKKLMLNLHLPTKDEIIVYGDDVKLQKIVINLIDNAIKYTNFGEINVTAILEPKNDTYRLFLEVSDTGIGIPEDKQDAIFNEFERIEEDGERRWETGTGLGLAITKRTIELLHGKINIKKSTKNGTIFTIEIPYEKPQLMKTTDIQCITTPTLSVSNKCILLVDDDPFSTLLIGVICKRNGIIIHTAENGKIALEMIKQNDFNLVLTDINMPVMSGIEMTRELRKIEKFATLPIIATTANVMADDVKYILSSGANDVIFKPYTEKDIIATINAHVELKG